LADYAFAPAGPATAGQGRTPAEPGAHRASLDGMDLVRPARHKQANKFLCLPSPGSTVMDVSGTSAQAVVRTWIKSIQKRTESCIRILAGAGNFDLQSVSGKAPTGEFTRYPISQLPQPHAPSRRLISWLAHAKIARRVTLSQALALVSSGKSDALLRTSCPTEGRCATSSTRDGMRWTRQRAHTKRAKADGEIVWSRRPDAESSLAGVIPRGDGGKRARSPGSTYKP
jgi:hypothetical protein